MREAQSEIILISQFSIGIKMNSFMLIAALVGAVYGRPDVSHLGYDSGVPAQGYLPSLNINEDSSVINRNYAQDSKNIYFYAAPTDEEPVRIKVRVNPSGHKNTKIIFVKAPSPGVIIPEVISPPSQSSDRTLVYVLVKKQDQPHPITISTKAQVQQAKPEVFFIKYGDKHEAEQAVQDGLNEQHIGQNANSLIDVRSFIDTIKESASSSHQVHTADNGGQNQYIPPATVLSGPY